MKNSEHSVHPLVAEKLAELDAVLAQFYPNLDFGYLLMVEGQIVSTSGRNEDVKPSVWGPSEVDGEVAKRADKPSVRLPGSDLMAASVLDLGSGRR